MNRPEYFDRVQQKAREQWQQLEADPDLAAPWHQLFLQVQSPRHVLSELLQNADDAGATEAHVACTDSSFRFRHNGVDFTEENFASLCRFGLSNKRALHTIGFRGIGFKSVFSLGAPVRVFSPTLAVAFERDRFTEPLWLDDQQGPSSDTHVRVEIADENLERQARRSLDDWRSNALSLLFLRNLRSLTIDGHQLRWRVDPGPVAGTFWVELDDQQGSSPLLLARSAPFELPREAQEEIRKERGATEDFTLPPACVDIVCGAPGRLFTILPTGVETTLPFACNAPFIQDPARLKIKDPEASPTNRFLLAQVGKLAGKTMLEWIRRHELKPADRARAYQLLPRPSAATASVAEASAALVVDAFLDATRDHQILLTDAGTLATTAVAVEVPLLEVWPVSVEFPCLPIDPRPPLSRYVETAHRDNLIAQGLVEDLTKRKILRLLQDVDPPKPSSWNRLLQLWEYLASELTSLWQRDQHLLHLVPGQASVSLKRGADLVRLGERKLIDSVEDEHFLSRHIQVVDPAWISFLRDLRASETPRDVSLGKDAQAVLEKINLHQATDVAQIVDRVARALTRAPGSGPPEWIHLAQIAARLDTKVFDTFRYITRDGVARPSKGLIVDHSGDLEDVLPPETYRNSVLHRGYESFFACTEGEWYEWVHSGRSGLHTFVAIAAKETSVWGQRQVNQLARRHRASAVTSQYRTEDFLLRDWDFPAACWALWEHLAEQHAGFWTRIAKYVAMQGEAYWEPVSTATIYQVPTTKRPRELASDWTPSWLLRLCELPCLLDARQIPRRPSELFRRTPDTEMLLEVESFVSADMDREAYHGFLDLLGVCTTPTGADRILERLRALAQSPAPPIREVEKWYRRLDQLSPQLGTEDWAAVRGAFETEFLIFSASETWETTVSVFRRAGREDVPGLPGIRAEVADLQLWVRLGVPERPTFAHAEAWLASLPSGLALDPPVQLRVRALLARFPTEIWIGAGRWLNLLSCLEPTESLKLASAEDTGSILLEQWVRTQTADFSMLTGDHRRRDPFGGIASLQERLEQRLVHQPRTSIRTQSWLLALAQSLSRLALKEPEAARVHQLAHRLAATAWSETTAAIEVAPYLDGTPAGPAREVSVLWLGTSLFVDARALSPSRQARQVPAELHRHFAIEALEAAFHFAFGRRGEEVIAYFEDNFELDSPTALAPPDPPAAPRQTTLLPIAAGASRGALSALSEALPPGGKLRESPSRAAPRARETKKLIAEFAVARGFSGSAGQGFSHPTLGHLVPTEHKPFQWEWLDANGESQRLYMVIARCLGREPMELPTEAWLALSSYPNSYGVIVLDRAGEPIEVTGAEIQQQVAAKKIAIHPTHYRLSPGVRHE